MASASAASDGGALAALETSAKWWGLGLASATVTPSSAALASVTPSALDGIGRALCRDGQSLLTIDVRGGRVILTPCAQWTIQGDADPKSWMYLCALNGPSRSTTITLPAASVVHVQIFAPHPSQTVGRSQSSNARYGHRPRCRTLRDGDKRGS